jgi:hypothetical protein
MAQNKRRAEFILINLLVGNQQHVQFITLQGSRELRCIPCFFQEIDPRAMNVFGDAMFDEENITYFRGKQAGLVLVIWKMLKRRQSGGKLVALQLTNNLRSYPR